MDYADLRLRLGQHAALVAELSGCARAYPLDERMSGQLMPALHRCGGTGDALAQYQATRRRPAEDLGIGPGLQLQRLHQQILTADTPAAPGASRVAAARRVSMIDVPLPPRWRG